MQISLKQAKILRETAARLIKQAEELEAGINRRQCKHGTYTNEPFNTHGCKTCGSPTWIICNNKKVVADRVNSNRCNPQNCKYFQSVTSNAVNIERGEHRTLNVQHRNLNEKNKEQKLTLNIE